MTSQKENLATDIQLTIDDFKNSGWKEAFKGYGVENPTSILEILSKLSKKAFEEGRTAHCKVLQLLIDASSMLLQPLSINEPFIPYSVTRIGSSAGPDDFSEQGIDYFMLILPSIDIPWLRARLSDLCWLRRRSQTDLALAAIDSYLEIPITLESFVNDGDIFWTRAIMLTSIQKNISGERMTTIQDRILETFRLASEKDGFLARWLSELLKMFRLGIGYEHEIAEKLRSLADEFKGQKNLYFACEYYESSAYWFDKADKEFESFKVIACQAEAWNIEAEKHENSANFLKVAHSLEKAIQIYCSIPNKHRSVLGIEDKLHQLRLQLNKAGQCAVENMTLISIPLPDIADMMASSRSLIQGKTSNEALKILTNLYPGAKKAKLRSSAEQTLTQQFHLSSFLSSTIISSDGRVVGKNPGLANAIKGTSEYEEFIQNEMIHYYNCEIRCVVPGRLIPALEVMTAEHRLRERDFVSFCYQSTIVPPNRELPFGKALFYGYDLDFGTAIPLLVPQVENMVRYHLKSASTVTTWTNEEGIEQEINLSALLEKPKAIQIFGEDLVFEMKALFCDSRGPNFRHGNAHGLLENKDFQSAFAIYTWYFILRLVLSDFWNSSRNG